MSDPVRTLADAERWLRGLIDIERRPDIPYRRLGLDAIRALLARLGDPQRGLSVLHVAGSKGKGSTALLAEAVLGAAGERVGTFTSPHLERWSERFRSAGAEVDDAALVAGVERIRPAVEAQRTATPESAPTFFDATTALALCLFESAGVDRAILEVGLGGRLDSTNIVTPALCALTSIELEHTDKLGGTLAEIAGEKAGILKAGVPVVCGALPPQAERVVADRAKSLDVPVVRLGHDFHGETRREGSDGLRVRYREGALELDVTLPLLGVHHGANVAVALACTRRLLGDDERWAEAARSGLAGARLPGRCEIVARRPLCLVDSAHTASSAAALGRVLASLPRRRTALVLSVSAGKDLATILASLLPWADSVTLTRAEPTRSLDPRELADAVRAAAPALPLEIVPDPASAVCAARAALGPEDLLCATGSVYLAGIARRVLRSVPA